MKKIILTATFAASLVAMSACSRSPEGAAIENTGDMMADNMEMKADSMDAMADNTSSAMASDMIENSADAMNSTTGDGSAAADNANAMATNKR